MPIGLFLNPLPPSAVRGKGRKVRRRKSARPRRVARRVTRTNPAYVLTKRGKPSRPMWKSRTIRGIRAMRNPTWSWARRAKPRIVRRARPIFGRSINPAWMWQESVGFDGKPFRFKSHSAWKRRTKSGRRKAARRKSHSRRSRSTSATRTRGRRRAMSRRRRTNPAWKRVGTRKGRKSKRAWKRALVRGIRRRRHRSRKNPLPVRRHRRSRRRSRRANPVVIVRRRRRRSSRRSRRNPVYRRRHYGRRSRRNPLALFADAKALTRKDALNTYAYVGAGFVAGGVLPTLIEKALAKFNVFPSGSVPVKIALGLGAAALAGIGTKMLTKSSEKAKLVAAGAVAGVVGALVLSKIEQMLPGATVSGLGSADDSVRRAIEAQVKRELSVSGMGEYLQPGELNGVGEYVNPAAVLDSNTVAGMGLEASEDIPEVDTFGDGGW